MSTEGGVDKGENKGIRILSLDSGGPGTYSQLLIVKEFMVRLASDLGVDESDIYPADYFDLMGGVGFGGLVAILLGQLRMNVDEAIDALLKVALAIFPDKGSSTSSPEANARQLREVLGDMLRRKGIPLDRKMQEKGELVGCRVTLYAATTANLSHPIPFRNYKPRGSSLNPTVIDAICATMANSSYFTPVQIGPPGRQQTFVGGPVGANNPTRELLKEASAIFGKEKLVSQILSIGCGRSHIFSADMHADAKGGIWVVQEVAADCETVEKELSARLCDMEAYLRLNVDRGMENFRMHEWHDLGSITTHTSAYTEATVTSEFLDASLKCVQGSAGSISVGEINHPSTAKDVHKKLDKEREDLNLAIKSVRDSEDSNILERLKPVDAPSYHEDSVCMEGTRTVLLDHLVAWALEPVCQETLPNVSNGASMYWLYGSPGLGKTSVANSLCDRLRRSGNLGGSFFCKHDNADLRDPKRILPTLIAKLVRMWDPFRRLVAKTLLDEPQINPESTRGELLLKSLKALKQHPPHPLILVIDALDECGRPNGRAPLLNSLLEACSLVGWLKVILTSRPEPDAKSFFDGHGIKSRDLATDDPKGKDIRLFTERRMEVIANRRHLSREWPGSARVSQIVERSRGLFIFVDALSKLVDVPTPEPLLVEVLSGNVEEANAELHKLYSTVITSRAVGNLDELHLILRAVIAVSACRPLCAETLAKLIGLDVATVLSWQDELSSLLYQDTAENNGIRVRHLSVLEFFVGSTCPPRFRVDQQLANSELTRYCLVTMENELQFNICELETSYLTNACIHDLNDRVKQRIPDSLQYSSLYWSNHLCYGDHTVGGKISQLLDNFFAGSQPLYWIEVLSLMGKASTAISALRLMRACFKRFEYRHRRLIEDTLRFVLAFFTPISTSAPHIYISALPFMPVESTLWKYANASFPEIIDVCKGRAKSWPAPSVAWQGHTDYIRSIAYSPDGQNIISGSGDSTIRVWDAQAGATVGKPLGGHTDCIWGVAYSPDGLNIVSASGDKTIRIWDAQTREMVGQPLEGHTDSVLSVAYSPDGQKIVSSSKDRTIRIWDAQTGAAVGRPLEGHTNYVWTVSYSPNGLNIVSGSDDMTVRIWDAQTGAAVVKPLKGHVDRIWCVTYSPDGGRILSSSADGTIRTWDARTGEVVRKPLEGHTNDVWSVAYSPDGRNIVSSSSDKTIRIWDAQTGASVGQPLKGHTDYVLDVAYSPDGRSIVSGSSDHMIRVWDTQTRAAVGESLDAHTSNVNGVAYSPDGRNIVSGSSDNLIRIWDAQTGAPIGFPLTGHTDSVWDVAYSPDSLSVVSGSKDKTVRIWDARTGVAVGKPLKGHTDYVWSVAYSPDGRNIVSSSSDKTIRIWDARTGAPVGQPLEGHTDYVLDVAYSPDGRNLVSASKDSTIRIWNAQSGAAVGKPLKGHSDIIRRASYSPDGQKVVSGSYDNTIRIWDARTGAAVDCLLRGHTEPVLGAVYSPDGHTIASCSSDMTIRIWDAHTGEAVGGPLEGHTSDIFSIAYSPDGLNVVSGAADNTIRIWDVQTAIETANYNLVSGSGNLPSNRISLTNLSGRCIPANLLDSNGWMSDADGLLLWIPEDCRNGLTSPAIRTLPQTGRQRPVRIDFSRFQYGDTWTHIRGKPASCS